MSLNYALVGVGRMGRAIDAVALERGHQRVASAGVDAELDAVLAARPDVAFEFTTPAAARNNVERLAAAGISVVCGTTGWGLDDAVRRALESGGAALVVEPNFALGVQLYLRLVREAARLAARFELHDPAIIEWHHRGKRDAPSGTARRMASLVQSVDPRIERIDVVASEGAPEPGTMSVVGIRVGSEPGRHQLILDARHDRIVLEHAARSRDGFAHGAVCAAEWVSGRSGIVTLESLIEERLGSAEPGADGGRT